MSLEDQKVKILYKTLTKHYWGKNIPDKEKTMPFTEIYDVILYIKKLAKKNKIRDLKGDKFCFLENFKIESDPEAKKMVIYGFIKSARNQFRPNLINKKTGAERPNPKLLTEDDIQKTHFAILIDENYDEVYFIHQHNYYGVTINNILDYFKYFSKEYAKKIDGALNFTLKYYIIPKDDFLEALNAMSRVKIADVYINKQILGSESLNLSNRTVNIKNEIKLSIGAKKRESIKSFAVDLFNELNGGNKSISKVRVEGKDIRGNDLIIDTSFMNKLDFITVPRNTDTGELMTNQVYAELKYLIEKI